jgi:hypothetical protein
MDRAPEVAIVLMMRWMRTVYRSPCQVASPGNLEDTSKSFDNRESNERHDHVSGIIGRFFGLFAVQAGPLELLNQESV